MLLDGNITYPVKAPLGVIRLFAIPLQPSPADWSTPQHSTHDQPAEWCWVCCTIAHPAGPDSLARPDRLPPHRHARHRPRQPEHLPLQHKTAAPPTPTPLSQRSNCWQTGNSAQLAVLPSSCGHDVKGDQLRSSVPMSSL